LGGLVDMFESSIEGREDIYYYGPRSLQYNASSYCEDIKSAPPPIKNYFCTKCSEAFYSAEGLAQHYLQEHYSLENPLSAPSLFVKGHPLPVKTTIRSRLSERDITVFHCDKYEVDKNGSGWHNFSEEEFKKLILTETDSTMMIRLTRFRRVDDSSSFSEYHLYFRIPQSTVLDGIDKAFFKYLVKKNLTHSDLSNFYSALPDENSAREYGDALGNFALALLIKESTNDVLGKNINFEEYTVKFHSAFDVLKHFHRPVAFAVTSVIRFNLNDFLDNQPDSMPVLYRANSFFQSLVLNRGAIRLNKALPETGEADGVTPICPVDQVSDLIIKASDRLQNNQPFFIDRKDFLALFHETPISEYDRVKIDVLFAESCLRSKRHKIAEPILRQFHPLFGDWARKKVEKGFFLWKR
jgi:hypothetical protein